MVKMKNLKMFKKVKLPKICITKNKKKYFIEIEQQQKSEYSKYFYIYFPYLVYNITGLQLQYKDSKNKV